METLLTKVVVRMPKITPIIGTQESETALEARIVVAANLLVGNYCVTEHNACTGLRHGRLNRVVELAGVLCQPRPEPIARVSQEAKGCCCSGAGSSVKEGYREA
jgi:hypothetical protein